MNIIFAYRPHMLSRITIQMTSGRPLGEDTGRQPDMTFQYPGKHLNLVNVQYGMVGVSTVRYCKFVQIVLL